MSAIDLDAAPGPFDGAGPATAASQALRVLAWGIVTATFVFLLNNYLLFWQGWPGFAAAFAGDAAPGGVQALQAWLQVGSYAACLIGPIAFVLARRDRKGRPDLRDRVDQRGRPGRSLRST